MDDNVVFIGKKGTMAYVMAVIMQMNNGNTEVTLKARGKAISRAVDVAEVVKNKFADELKSHEIKIYTEEVKGRNNENLRISAIEISLKK
ncbi:MAG TPA: DNA-binding protein Alba [archaeon]|nr:DNA-binding protein Alba [archaeon]